MNNARSEKYSLFMISTLSVLIFVSVWELSTRLGLIDPIFLPAPSDVFQRAVRTLENGTLVANVLASTRRVMIGFLMSVAVSVPLGLVLGSSRRACAVFDPIISLLRPLPSMSWIPLSLLWFGITETQKYSIVFMGTIAPALLYVIDATRNVDKVLIQAARNMGASHYQVMRHVILPASLSQIIIGFKIILGLAWTCVISAELIAAKEGLGFMIMNGKEFFQTDTVVLGMVMISLTVLIIDALLRRIEKRVLAWK
ncbi:Putative aliphatic sulfonates transport permease protein SsuC [Oligella urethralis]|uniref:Aliphatic sulfonates transport permease protein ssuC n=1 Tax=Oligella urethralis TaxID=90245 RepID=A0A2X1UJ60_9BURK|nr:MULTISPECIES: ABC transporter permease [Oligella]MDK6203191.1 ABC transporter permease [Oligella urethralis]OFV47195.1 ABC transporter permease [Oligella sp. HMSC09E12]WOS38227.1 Putative aliphatic sulfonates transport permease protein SsuC [Oligella urethralis]SPY07239.1 Putative aliphatic sulfonates transport permease protein ssuC [Oligella urethralis]SUA66472.1 Putative aliphatic sulfonates transport permease protein ssuC [Oligella urethralis]